MQQVDLGLKQVEAAVSISAEHVETLISTFVDTDDWRTSLRRFGVYGPPSGDVQKNIVAVEQQMRASPLQYLITKTVLGPDNVPIRIVSSEADHRDVALSEHEKIGISLWAVFAAEILDRVQGRHGVPDSPTNTQDPGGARLADQIEAHARWSERAGPPSHCQKPPCFERSIRRSRSLTSTSTRRESRVAGSCPLWTSRRAVAIEILKVAAASAKLTKRRLTGWNRSGPDLVPGDRGSIPSPVSILSLGTAAASTVDLGRARGGGTHQDGRLAPRSRRRFAGEGWAAVGVGANVSPSGGSLAMIADS